MSNKIVVFLSTIFPAKPEPIQTVEPYNAPTPSSQIGSQPTAEPDYIPALRDWGWIR